MDSSDIKSLQRRLNRIIEYGYDPDLGDNFTLEQTHELLDGLINGSAGDIVLDSET